MLRDHSEPRKAIGDIQVHLKLNRSEESMILQSQISFLTFQFIHSFSQERSFRAEVGRERTRSDGKQRFNLRS